MSKRPTASSASLKLSHFLLLGTISCSAWRVQMLRCSCRLQRHSLCCVNFQQCEIYRTHVWLCEALNQGTPGHMDTGPRTKCREREVVIVGFVLDLKRKNCMRKKRYVVNWLCVCACVNHLYSVLHLWYDLHVEAGGARLLAQGCSRRQELLGLLWPDQVLLLQADGGVAVGASAWKPPPAVQARSCHLVTFAFTPVQVQIHAVKGLAGRGAASPDQGGPGGEAQVLLYGAQLDGVQLDAGRGRLAPLVLPPRGGLGISGRLGRPFPLRLPLFLPRQPSADGLLQAAAAVQAAAPLPHAAARLGAAGLATVWGSGGETLVGVVDIEGILSAAHAVSLWTPTHIKHHRRRESTTGFSFKHKLLKWIWREKKKKTDNSYVWADLGWILTSNETKMYRSIN